MSHECYGVSIQRGLNCLFNSLFRLATKKSQTLRITGPLCGDLHQFPVDSHHETNNAESVSVSWRNRDRQITNHTTGMMLMFSFHAKISEYIFHIWEDIYIIQGHTMFIKNSNALWVVRCPPNVPYHNFVRTLSSSRLPWWRHPMETFSALLAICAGNTPVTVEFLAQGPVTRSFDVFFDLPPPITIVRLVNWNAIAPIITSL